MMLICNRVRYMKFASLTSARVLWRFVVCGWGEGWIVLIIGNRVSYMEIRLARVSARVVALGGEGEWLGRTGEAPRRSVCSETLSLCHGAVATPTFHFPSSRSSSIKVINS